MTDPDPDRRLALVIVFSVAAVIAALDALRARRSRDCVAVPMSDRRLHRMIRENKRSPEGKHSLAYGVRVGYWPCLRAPYVQLAVHRWRIEVWFGLPSYKNGGRA